MPATGTLRAIRNGSMIDNRIADPAASIWISASAGTGKTKSLIDRILALLFNGVCPNKILCLTYTKAAAHEMLNRLAQTIANLHEQPTVKSEQFPLLSKEFIDNLYEKSLSASWVTIQTIHSFSFSLLRQTAIETGLYPHIELCDESTKSQLINNAIATIFNDSANYEDLKIIMANTNNFADVFKDNFFDISHFLGYSPQLVELYSEKLQVESKFLPLNAKQIVQELFKDIFENRQKEIFKSLAEKLCTSSKKTDLKNANLLMEQSENPDENFVSVFLTDDGNIRKNLCTNDVKDIVLEEMEENAVRAQLFALRLNNIRTAQSNIAFFRVSQAIIRQFQVQKSLQHCIDYDDVIDLTINLLHNFSWIMYKIDSQIEHVLVDEAQDTSPEQWEIVKLITQEFFSNYQSGKTIFVVGDEKQSIFSFQGANVEYFQEMHKYFKQAATISGARFYDITLAKSYRTVGNILDFVDCVFTDIFPGIHHDTARDSQTGIVQIMPLIPSDKEEENPIKSELQLAQQIADVIDNTLKDNIYVPSKQRIIRPSDFMILFKKRDLSTYMVRHELKKRHIPVAEVDRVKLKDELAINDLICLAKFVLLPVDELMCARVLRSSLVGISEDELMNLCLQRQGENLWEFTKKSGLYERYGLKNLQKYIDEYTNLSPYHFFTQVLNDGNFEKIVGRLGNVCIDAINEFLHLTLRYAKSNSNILQNFLNWFDEADIDLKRDISNQNNAVQLITVHGSKGLQAPFVILANANTLGKNDLSVTKLDENIEQNYFELLWKPWGKVQGKLVQSALDNQRRKDKNESNRLLYVAMTRAEDFLYVFGIEPKKKSSETWYDILTKAHKI